MSLEQVMTSHTYRQYRVFIEWEKNQWNEPSRSDWYLMQIAQEIRDLANKTAIRNAASAVLSKFNIPFAFLKKGERSATEKVTMEKANEAAQSKWMGWLWGSLNKKK